MKAIIIEEDKTVNIRDITDDITEISAMLDSGFVCAVLRLNNGKIEYAHVDYDNNLNEYSEVIWKEPIEIKEE